MDFNYIDALLIFVVLCSVLVGWGRGFILGLLDLARWVGSFLAALAFYRAVAGFVSQLFGWDEIWAQPLAFILVAVVVSLLIQLLGSRLLKNLSTDVPATA